MKHAICVIGYGSSRVLQETINHLDSPNIDFYIHWDKKYPLPKLQSKFSKIFLLKNRVNVHWGTYTQIQAELNLLKAVKDSNYDYVHLISSTDIPLMTLSYFENFFKKDFYIGFQHPLGPNVYKRLSYYYPIDKLNISNKLWLIKIIKVINILFGVDRLKNQKERIKKGPQWFSIKGKYINRILSFDTSIFKNTFLCDECFIQTIFGDIDTGLSIDDNMQAARYIKWNGRKNSPHPVTFNKNDISELKQHINENFAFCRKVTDPEIINLLFDNGKKVT